MRTRGAIDLHEVARPKILDPCRIKRNHPPRLLFSVRSIARSSRARPRCQSTSRAKDNSADQEKAEVATSGRAKDNGGVLQVLSVKGPTLTGRMNFEPPNSELYRDTATIPERGSLSDRLQHVCEIVEKPPLIRWQPYRDTPGVRAKAHMMISGGQTFLLRWLI
jgi:hypothetical protein